MIEQETKSIEVIEHYFNIDRYEQVIEHTKHALGDHPEDSYLWYLLGFSSYALNLFDEAEEQLLEAMRLGYDEEVICHVLGHLYLETERWQESEEMFLETFRLNPNDAEAHASYALLMKMTGNKKKAKLLIKKAFELDPESPKVLRLHYLLEGINEPQKEQIVALEQYLNSTDSELGKFIQLGINATYRNDIKEAREYFRQAFLLKPEDENLLKILEEIDIVSHPLYAPNLFIDRIGGPVMFWIIGVGMTFLLFYTIESLGIVWVICYAALASYTWIAEPLVKIVRKIRG